MAMLVPVTTEIHTSDIFRLMRIKNEENRLAIEKRNRQMARAGTYQYYRQQTGEMKKLAFVDQPTVLLTVAPQKHTNGPLKQIRTPFRNDRMKLKELVENAVKKSLKLHGIPVLGAFLSHDNYLYAQFIKFPFEIPLIESRDLDNCTVICIS